MSTIDEEKSEECTVVMYIPFEVWKELRDLISFASTCESILDYTQFNFKDLKSWLDDCVQNYDGVPVDFYSNRKAVINNKTGSIIYLT